MVLRLMAAGAAVDVAKKIGEQASVTLIDFIYQPLVKSGRGKSKKMIPDPHYPHGIRIALPAWFVGAVLALGGVALLSFLINALMKDFMKSVNPLDVLKDMASNPFKGFKLPGM